MTDRPAHLDLKKDHGLTVQWQDGESSFYSIAYLRKMSPAADARQLREEMNTVTVNVTNSNGSIIPVKLKKQGVGYVGPRGEYYDHLPTNEELRPVYGF